MHFSLYIKWHIIKKLLKECSLYLINLEISAYNCKLHTYTIEKHWLFPVFYQIDDRSTYKNYKHTKPCMC